MKLAEKALNMLEAIKKGTILKPETGIELKVIEPAKGYVSGERSTNEYFWVRVTKGTWQEFSKGEELVMHKTDIEDLK